MAPKQRQRKEDKAEEDVFQLETEKEPKAEKINLGDTASLKRALDEAVIEAACEAGFMVDNTYTDLKIALGLLACALACLAQFYPAKYPDNKWLLAGCVAGYLVLSSLMTVVAVMVEKDTIAFTRAELNGPPALAIASRLPRFQDLYTLRIGPRGARGSAKGGSGNANGCVSLVRSVGEYFHEDGLLAAEVIKADAARLLQQAVDAKTK